MGRLRARRAWLVVLLAFVVLLAAVVFFLGYTFQPIHPRWLAGALSDVYVFGFYAVSTTMQRWVTRRMNQPYDGNDRSKLVPRDPDRFTKSP